MAIVRHARRWIDWGRVPFLVCCLTGCSPSQPAGTVGPAGPASASTASHDGLPAVRELAAQRLFETVRPVGESFSIQLPHGRINVSQGGSRFPVAVTDVNGDWKLTVEPVPADSEFSEQRTIDWIQWKLSTKQVHEISNRPFEFDGDRGRKLVVSFKEPVEREGSALKLTAAYYILIVGERGYVCTGICSTEGFADWEGLFDHCAASFRIEP